MSFAVGSSHGLKYIAETNFGELPSSPKMAKLRHTSCSLAVNKDSFQSEELRSDAQISDFRHGLIQVSGDIGFELSYGEYDNFLAAAVRGAWSSDILKAGVTLKTFSIEREFTDIGQFELFTGCAINSLSLDIQPSQMVTGTMSFVGKQATFKTATSAASETPSQTYSPLDGFSGSLKEGGTVVANITSLSLQIENSIEPANVLGMNTAKALLPGRINCTGTVSAFFENLTLLNKFINETESSLEVTLGNGTSYSYIITIPRLKYSGGENPTDGEGAIALNMPFQALLDSTSGTNLQIRRIGAAASSGS